MGDSIGLKKPCVERDRGSPHRTNSFIHLQPQSAMRLFAKISFDTCEFFSHEALSSTSVFSHDVTFVQIEVIRIRSCVS